MTWHGRDDRQSAHSVFAGLPVPAVVVDAAGVVVEANTAWGHATRGGCGHDPPCGPGTPYLASCAITALGAAARDELGAAIAIALLGESQVVEVDGADHAALVHLGPLTARDESVPGAAVVVWTDTTEARRRERVLAAQVVRDHLTGLPNRAWFVERLRTALSRDGARVAVLLCGLDGFKLVNDSLGHLTGDRLLVECSRRLQGALEPGQVLARLGGDEFAVLCEDAGAVEAGVIADRLLAALGTTAVIGTATLPVGASIGVGLSRPGGSAEDLVRAADIAMERAKDTGRGRWEVFDATLQAQAMRRLATETALRAAVTRDELQLAYQPIVDLRTRAVQGLEALLRWRHTPERVLGPATFLEVAADSGLLLPIGRWVIDRAIAQLADWRRCYPDTPVTVGVNLSAGEVGQPGLVDHVARSLDLHGADPAHLVVEIAERTLGVDSDATRQALVGLRALGVVLTIDDFGSGASSLARLQQLPVHGLKIHRTFIEGLPFDHASRAIVEATLGLARALDVRPIAAGVETREQAQYLAEHGCPLGQGFLYGPPMDPAEVDALLAGGGVMPSRIQRAAQEPALPTLGSR